jgi:hypothetical protein
VLRFFNRSSFDRSGLFERLPWLRLLRRQNNRRRSFGLCYLQRCLTGHQPANRRECAFAREQFDDASANQFLVVLEFPVCDDRLPATRDRRRSTL